MVPRPDPETPELREGNGAQGKLAGADASGRDLLPALPQGGLTMNASASPLYLIAGIVIAVLVMATI